MPEIVARLGVLILVSLLLWLLIWSGRHLVEIQRRRALAAPPLRGLADIGDYAPARLLCVSWPSVVLIVNNAINSSSRRSGV